MFSLKSIVESFKAQQNNLKIFNKSDIFLIITVYIDLEKKYFQRHKKKYPVIKSDCNITKE